MTASIQSKVPSHAKLQLHQQTKQLMNVVALIWMACQRTTIDQMLLAIFLILIPIIHFSHFQVSAAHS